MGKFTADEIAAELKRRDERIRQQEEDRQETDRMDKLQRADTTCLHCGNRMNSWDAGDPENPICGICL